MRMPAQEDRRMRIHMRMPMRIFATLLYNTSYYQMGAAFVKEYKICIY